ncbi:carboxypeptidase C [Thozetella sp. PMI_491]|nr:carboxypeptidase C [Thozetella sp. PMI_491]
MKPCAAGSLLAFSGVLARSSGRPSVSDVRFLEGHTSLHALENPYNVSIRFREPRICETTPGVRSYSGYVDTGEASHTFFWFFEARENPETAPVTVWLNGGPGSDSLVGLFQEVGPCSVNPDLTTQLNPYSWSQISHLLFLSQPLGVGFSYSSSLGIDATIDTTEKAAAATWHVLQGFMGNLPTSGKNLTSRELHLWTESYGGHYGPTFGQYFEMQNEKIKIGSLPGIPLRLATLGIGNGIIDAAAQFPSYPDFAMNNTYGIKSVPDDVYTHMNFSCYMRNGCLEQISRCREAIQYARNSIETTAACVEATNMCRDNVEGPYYEYSGRNMYDIRRPSGDRLVSDFFTRYLNLPQVQEALGVEKNFTYQMSSNQVYSAFQQSGDYVFGESLDNLGHLLDKGTRVVLMYGDSDYIGNWLGGEAVSLAVSYTEARLFRNASYQPFTFNGALYGTVREYGNLSFVVVSDAGHLVPSDKPDAALELFRRAITGVDISSGQHSVFGTTTPPLQPDPPATGTTHALGPTPHLSLESAVSSLGSGSRSKAPKIVPRREE